MLKFTITIGLGFLSLATAIATTVSMPAHADNTPIQISSSPHQSKVLKGYTRGTVGLHNIVGERDQNRNRCMGYGSASPDHRIELTRGVAQFSLQIRSQRKDTTLAIKGPDNSVFCADDSSLGEDAGMTLNNLPPGLYEIWVGAFDAGDNFSYTLSIR